MAGDINFKLRYIVPLHPEIPRAHTVRKLGPEIPSELALRDKFKARQALGKVHNES